MIRVHNVGDMVHTLSDGGVVRSFAVRPDGSVAEVHTSCALDALAEQQAARPAAGHNPGGVGSPLGGPA